VLLEGVILSEAKEPQSEACPLSLRSV
jgi:hypothetical protein